MRIVFDAAPRRARIVARASALALVLGLAALVTPSTAGAADIYAGGGGLKDYPGVDYPDVPAALAPAWAGFYIGGHIGGAWTDVEVTDTYEYHFDPIATNTISGVGLIGAGTVGYNILSGPILYGVEFDLGWMDLSRSGTFDLLGGTHSLSGNYASSGGLYGDITGRLGYAFGRTLFYAKGGAAFLNADFDARYVGDGKYIFDFSHSETLWGWTLGGGVEYALSPALSLKLEYQHFDFGDGSFTHNGAQSCGGACMTHLSGAASFTPTVDAVTVGVSYHFGRNDSDLK